MSRRRKLRGLGAAVLAAAPFVFQAPAQAGDAGPWICLTQTRGTGAEVARYPLGPAAEFRLSFIHSVSRTPVTDHYRVEAGRIIQTSEVFEAHGAGLPSIADDVGATGWRHEDGKFILDLDRETGPIPMRIQAQFKNTLHIADRDLPLADLGQAALTLAPCDEETHQ
ncbi:DUF1850 domain-containing protein [Mesobaculum littorinae]|uniref:DUF1850 domain-containing protein n=1 Tax=Mesobaculum littorinae TaxID=2486419 RepID=A0A438AI65_9RHOB|nr:DUF1850 domain-containing protein [Mesobaculum littorinae]RVV98399.1 DUF1850 domain-containing protein [Mesobaculum littorinae]